MLSASRPRFRWLSWVAGLLAIGTMLVLSVVFRVGENRSRLWPVTRAVATRLATDEGARDLFAKNPQLADYYASADAFVEAVRAHRAAFGTLPDGEPGMDRNRYMTDSDPQGFHAYVRGSGGDWMTLQVERSDGTEAGHAAIGEGITFLGFAGAASELKELESSMRDAFAENLWIKFRAVEQSLHTEEGTLALLKGNPSLAKDDAARTAFLQQARAWRPRLLAATLPATWAKGVEAPDDVVSLNRRSMPPFQDKMEMGWKPKDGAWLRVTWDQGSLVKVALED